MGGSAGRLIDAANRSLEDMTGEERACALVSAMAYRPSNVIQTPLGELRKVAEGGNLLNGMNMVAYVNDEVLIFGFRGTDVKNAGDLLADVGIAVAGSVAYAPQCRVRDLAKQHGAGKSVYITGHSLGGVIATATWAAFVREGFKLQVFNCGTGVGEHFLQLNLLPLEHLRSLFSSKMATHHHIIGDIVSGGTHVCADVKAYFGKEGCGPHDLKNFIHKHQWLMAGHGSLKGVVQNPCWGGAWECLTKVHGANGVFALKTCHGTYITVHPDGHLTQTWEWLGWETFHQEGGDDNFALKPVCHDGKYLCAKPDGSFALADQWQAWETFQQQGGHDCFAIKTVHGTYLSAQVEC